MEEKKVLLATVTGAFNQKSEDGTYCEEYNDLVQRVNEQSYAGGGLRCYPQIKVAAGKERIFIYKEQSCANSMFIATEKGNEAVYKDFLDAIRDPESQMGFFAIGIEKNAFKIEMRVVKEKKSVKKNLGDYFSESKKYAIEQGFDEKQLDEKIAYLVSQKVPKKSILMGMFLRSIRKQPDGKTIQKPKKLFKKSSGQNLIKVMLSYLLNKNNVKLEGNMSTGKNVAWETIAWLLNCEIFALQCGPRQSFSEIFGSNMTDNSLKDILSPENAEIYNKYKKSPEDCTKEEKELALKYQSVCDRVKSPALKFEASTVTKALEWSNMGYGAILLLDEMNLGDPDVLGKAFNNITVDHRTTTDIGIKRIAVSEKLFVGATQNGDSYTGVKKQNQATSSRFAKIVVQNSTSIRHLLEDEAQKHIEFLISEYGIEKEVDDALLNNMDNIYSAFLSATKGGATTRVSDDCLSIRGFNAALRAVLTEGMELKQAINECVITNLSKESDRLTLNNLMDDAIAS